MANKRKGVSLIVLVITIIIIVVISTAIIVSVVKNNPIGKATEAVVKQDFSTMQEELTTYLANKYAESLGEYDKSSLNADSTTVPSVYDIITSLKNSKYDGYVSIIEGKIAVSEDMPNFEYAKEILGNQKGNKKEYPKVEIGKKVEGSNATITGMLPKYNNPVIPVGFSAEETTKATWSDSNSDGSPDGWNEGLVIKDEQNNEYVWIPVDGTTLKYEKWDRGVDTAWSVRSTQVSDDTLPSGVTSEKYQIEKYGGYYVARYEAGLPDIETTEELMATKTFSAGYNNRTDIGKAQSKPEKIVWNRIDYNNAKKNAEAVISNSYVQSGLITGTQWDTMCKFIEETGLDTKLDSTSWGNYNNKYGYTVSGYYRTQHADVVYAKGEYTKTANGYLLLQTGKFGEVIEEGSPKNIYDVAGNVWEWSAETVAIKGGANTTVGNKLLRGGGYLNDGYDSTASYRYGFDAAPADLIVGFRFVLYIK